MPAFVWDNFGPMHADRVDAVARHLSGEPVVGLELFSQSDTYAWDSASGSAFEKVTLFPGRNWGDVSGHKIAFRILSECRRRKLRHVFLCNYDQPGIFLAGVLLRAAGRRVYVMGCSKFDDLERTLWREVAKTAFFLPYKGAIASGYRSVDYMRFLGVPKQCVVGEYNTLSIDRIRALSGKEPAPGGTPHADRHFTIVARFVPKKNLPMMVDAYRRYRERTTAPRDLHICGSGPMENELRARVAALGLADHVIFRGFLQTEGIAAALGDTLALILPSVEEQFGNVVIEAQAMGVPCILAVNCGARDKLLRSGVNGFLAEPDNPDGFAYFMRVLAEDETQWRQMARAAFASAEGGDVARFVEAVAALVSPPPPSKREARL